MMWVYLSALAPARSGSTEGLSQASPTCVTQAQLYVALTQKESLDQLRSTLVDFPLRRPAGSLPGSFRSCGRRGSSARAAASRSMRLVYYVRQ